MKGPVSLALAFGAVALAVPWRGALAEPSQPAQVSQMADTVQRLQTQIAAGDKTAYPAEIAELKAMADAIAGATPQTWNDKREADALVVYVLSGGAVAPVATLAKSEALAPSEQALARGALAYVTNHEADALELLGPLDLATLDARLAGPVAFARSVLKTRRDPKGAIVDLDWARLLAPGELVEEAALRREITLLAETPDPGRVALLTRQYAERFAASPYAPDFFRDLAQHVARTGLADDPANFRLLSQATARLPGDGRRAFLLAVARTAALNGRVDVAASAAGEALQGAAAGSAEEARGRLYLAAGKLFSDAYDAALADLQGVAAARLDRSDAALLAAARSVAAQLRAPPAAADGPAAGPGAAAKDEEAPAIAKAEEALKRTESLVAGAGGAP